MTICINFRFPFNKSLYIKCEETGPRVSEEKTIKGVNGRTDERPTGSDNNSSFGSGEVKTGIQRNAKSSGMDILSGRLLCQNWFCLLSGTGSNLQKVYSER